MCLFGEFNYLKKTKKKNKIIYTVSDTAVAALFSNDLVLSVPKLAIEKIQTDKYK